jgi:hypothetical protein
METLRIGHHKPTSISSLDCRFPGISPNREKRYFIEDRVGLRGGFKAHSTRFGLYPRTKWDVEFSVA